MSKLDNDDLKAIKGQIEVTFDKKLDEKLDEKLSHLSTKAEFYTEMDEVMGELKTIRQVQALQSQYLSDHEDRSEKLNPTWTCLRISLVPQYVEMSKFTACEALHICKFPLS